MDNLESDKFLQTALSDFARTRRVRKLQLIAGAMLVFGLGFLAGASYQYQSPMITVDLPAPAPPLEREIPKTTQT